MVIVGVSAKCQSQFLWHMALIPGLEARVDRLGLHGLQFYELCQTMGAKFPTVSGLFVATERGGDVEVAAID